MGKLKVGFVQINSEFSGQVYLPLVAGYLTGYFQKYSRFASKFEFIEPIFKRDKVELVVEKLKECDVVAFSIYVWNEQLSLRIAEKLKILNPNVLIVFGGPQVPDQAEKFLKKHEFIDICVHNEGEQPFLEILEAFYQQLMLDIPNTSRLVKDEYGITYSKRANRPKLRDLDKIPSPFLNGYFDLLLKNNPTQIFLALWESNRGCPFSCTFCDWGSATASKVYQFDLDRLYKEIAWIGKNKIPFVFVCDANFGLLPRDEELAKFVSETKSAFGYPEAFSTQNTKNVKDRSYKVQKILSDSGLSKGVTLSMQSLNTKTLELIKRDNISLSTYSDLQNKFRRDGVLTYSDLILGLPGETLASWKNGITELIKNGQHNRIQFNNLSILPNAEMSKGDYIADSGFITVPSQIVNVHGSKIELENDVPEIQELVVGTKTMPVDDWVKARVFAWWVALTYFDKLFQIPLLVITDLTKVEVGEQIDKIISVVENNSMKFPVLTEINNLFTKKAISIQQGDVEYTWDPKLIDVYWPMDEYAFIEIVVSGKISEVYSEFRNAIYMVLMENVSKEVQEIIFSSIHLNKSLLNLPKVYDIDFILTSNEKEILKIYLSNIMPHVDVNTLVFTHEFKKSGMSLEDWQRKVVWYGHRSGEYLKKFYQSNVQGNQTLVNELPGHYT